MATHTLCPWSPIQSLLMARGPATIAGFVVTIIVDAIDAVFRRGSPSHIREKLFKRFTPLHANCNAPSAIIAIRYFAGILATTFHAAPRLVFRRGARSLRYAMRLTVSDRTCSADLSTETPTTHRVSTPKTGNDHGARGSTVALAQCASIFGSWRRREFLRDNQTPEALAENKDTWRHGPPSRGPLTEGGRSGGSRPFGLQSLAARAV